VLLAASGPRGPTGDIDLQATGVANGVAAVLERVQEIAVIDVGDGSVFGPGSITADTIRGGRGLRRGPRPAWPRPVEPVHRSGQTWTPATRSGRRPS
jgi:hypothetical protein